MENNKKASMQTIADSLNITKVSVSKALNNKKGISQSLRIKVLNEALEQGYTKHLENDKKIEYFGFVVSRRFFLENEKFYSTIFYYLNIFCQENKQKLINFVVDDDDEVNLNLPEILREEKYDGLFFAGEISENYLKEVTKLNIPIVLLDFYSVSLEFDCIINDNFFIGCSATEFLIKNGHREIGFVGNVLETTSISDRYFGYRKALHKHNIQYNDDYTISNNNLSGAYTLDFKLPDKMPTAFVCHCDMAAHYLMQKLKSLSYVIPDDVSIISFDNTELGATTLPKLTSYEIDKQCIAEYAYSQMLKRIENPQAVNKKIYTDNRLIIRDSVKNINNVEKEMLK